MDLIWHVVLMGVIGTQFGLAIGAYKRGEWIPTGIFFSCGILLLTMEIKNIEAF